MALCAAILGPWLSGTEKLLPSGNVCRCMLLAMRACEKGTSVEGLLGPLGCSGGGCDGGEWSLAPLTGDIAGEPLLPGTEVERSCDFPSPLPACKL